jgi:hypothetical protein
LFPEKEAAIRSRVRQSDRAARQLLDRAAHIEKSARRPALSARERQHLNEQALELRAAANRLLADVCELAAQLRVG